MACSMPSHTFTGRLGVGGAVTGLAYSPDGTMVATDDIKGHLQLWSTATRARISSLTPDPGKKVGVLAFSPSGNLLASDEPDGVRVWRVTGHRLKSLGVIPVTAPAALAFNANDNLLAVGDDSGGIVLFDFTNGKMTAPFLAAPASAQEQIVEGLQFTPDGTRLVSAVGTGIARVWDVTVNQGTATLRLTATLPVDDRGEPHRDQPRRAADRAGERYKRNAQPSAVAPGDRNVRRHGALPAGQHRYPGVQPGWLPAGHRVLDGHRQAIGRGRQVADIRPDPFWPHRPGHGCRVQPGRKDAGHRGRRPFRSAVERPGEHGRRV